MVYDVEVIDEKMEGVVQHRDAEIVLVRNEVMKIALLTARPVAGEIGYQGRVVTHQSDFRVFQRDIEAPIPLGVPLQRRRHRDGELVSATIDAEELTLQDFDSIKVSRLTLEAMASVSRCRANIES